MFDENEDIVEKINLIKYHCPNCSGIFFTNEKNIFNNCILCNSTDLEKEDSSLDNNIKIIPFNKEYKDAVRDYNKKVRNLLVPIEFKKKSNFSTLQKVYIPVFITNVSMNGKVEFIGADNNSKNSAIGNTKYDIVQSVNFNYNDVILKTNSKVDDDTFNIINDYDFSNLMDINIDYFDDSFYLNEDISIDDVSTSGRDTIIKHAMKHIRSKVNHSMKKVRNDSTIVRFDNTRKVLIPLYILKVRYKDNDYSYIMNGQTGKSYINLPINTMNIIIVSIVSFILVFLISFLISYFF